MTQSIYQLVHGYAHGHRLLAGSAPLAREDADLVTRLSDLSGGMVADEPLTPYVTVYPLPSKAFYAIAKTWPDALASRTGCVLTHTVLVPMEVWAVAADVAMFASLLRFPERNVQLSILEPSQHASLEAFDDTRLDDFIVKFFGEGIRPLVWFAAHAPEATTWRLLSALWPALRAEFSCCTLALQPRTLDERPFDLMFAPVAARSRFAEYLGAHEVTGRDGVEVWATEWKGQVLGSTRSDELVELCAGLDAAPNAIRKVYLFFDLHERSRTAPLAAIGALDLLESLGTHNHRVSALVADLVTRAVEGTSGAPVAWALEVLCLVGLRIDRIDSNLVDPRVRTFLVRTVRESVERDPIESMRLAEAFSTRDIGRLPRTFVCGIVDALTNSASYQGLSALSTTTHVGVNILQVLPGAATTLIRAGRRCGAPMGDALLSWYSDVRDTFTRTTLRTALIPEVAELDEVTLLDVLLHDVLPSELEGLLSDLYSHTVAPELGRLYADVLGVRFSDEVMKWASSRVPMRDTVAGYLVAGAAPLTLDGIQYVAAVDSTGFALVILVDRMLRRPASHVLRLAAMEPMFWERLLDSLDDPFVGSVLVRLVGSVDRSAIGLARGAIENLRCAPRAVQAHAVRESLLDHLHGLTEVAELRRWLVAAWGSSILDSDASLLRAAIADSLSSGPEQFSQTWVRAWRTLEAVGLSVPGSSPAVVDICSLLLSKSPTPWPAVVVDSWCTLLKAESHDILRQEVACVQALRFCFDHTKLPLGPIVAQAFFAVHDAAMHHNVDRPRWDLFGWTNWDKGAELRRRLVDAFSHGDWEPHWFVLAAGEPWLLRKLCKRMLRQWRGQAFLERALERLRVEPPNVLTVELADILRAPGYIVDWD